MAPMKSRPIPANANAASQARFCQCGCAAELPKTKPHQRFVSAAHRQRAYAARQQVGK